MDALAEELIKAAREARERAYAPYSGFKVGAAVLGASGKMYGGCNVENASYGLTQCAERTAICSAVAAGERALEAIAILADTPDATAPCGACRQVIAEFRIPRVILANLAGRRRAVTLEALLPGAFSPQDMKEEKQL